MGTPGLMEGRGGKREPQRCCHRIPGSGSSRCVAQARDRPDPGPDQRRLLDPRFRILEQGAAADAVDGQEEDFFGMSIEELLNVDIYSVSKSPRKLTESPAAIFVLTCEDIRRSGATSIPDLLRVVPGLNVARSESGRWQVSSRGFNQSFSTKLLVLIDGRT